MYFALKRILIISVHSLTICGCADGLGLRNDSTDNNNIVRAQCPPPMLCSDLHAIIILVYLRSRRLKGGGGKNEKLSSLYPTQIIA